MNITQRAKNLFIAILAFVVAAPCAALVVVMANAVLDGAMAALLGMGR